MIEDDKYWFSLNFRGLSLLLLRLHVGLLWLFPIKLYFLLLSYQQL